VRWSRDHLGAFPRPIETVLGVPALAWGCHMRARRRQGWWLCAFGVAATAPVASALVNPAISLVECGLSVLYGLVIGLVQCASLVPGVSRSGATISAGLFRGLDRLTATRLSFFMAIPALTAAGVFELLSETDHLKLLGVGPIIVGIIVSFVVAYASIAWLLKFVSSNKITAFVWYRVALGVVLLVVLAAGWMTAT
jgi:undecaprenyl-diphosphatase